MMNLVIAFFLTVGASLPYCMHVQYGLHGTEVSVQLLYSTVCSMLTVVHHYQIVCVYRLHCTVVSVHLLYTIIHTMLV